MVPQHLKNIILAIVLQKFMTKIFKMRCGEFLLVLKRNYRCMFSIALASPVIHYIIGTFIILEWEYSWTKSLTCSILNHLSLICMRRRSYLWVSQFQLRWEKKYINLQKYWRRHRRHHYSLSIIFSNQSGICHFWYLFFFCFQRHTDKSASGCCPLL